MIDDMPVSLCGGLEVLVDEEDLATPKLYLVEIARCGVVADDAIHRRHRFIGFRIDRICTRQLVQNQVVVFASGIFLEISLVYSDRMQGFLLAQFSRLKQPR